MFIPYNDLQFFDWPSIAASSPAGMVHIMYGLMIFRKTFKSLS